MAYKRDRVDVLALRAVLARIRSASVREFGATVRPTKKSCTVADVRVGRIQTSRSVEARLRRALIDLCLAQRTRITSHATARKEPSMIHTRRTIDARIRRTFIYVRLAPRAAVGRCTCTRIRIDTVQTRAVGTRLGTTVVYIGLTFHPGVPQRTRTRKRTDMIDARTTVDARRTRAFVNVRYTIEARITSNAYARIRIDSVIGTGTAVLTRSGCA